MAEKVSLHSRLLTDRRVIGAAALLRKGVLWASAPTPGHREWRRIDGDHTLRLDYDLGPDSVVLDVGGFEGQWASDLVAMYGCHIHVFEPVPEYAERISRRFAKNPLVTVHADGLAPAGGTVLLDVSGDTSSHARAGTAAAATVRATLVGAQGVIEGLPGGRADLMKVNIEGAEYDLLDHLVATGVIERIRDLQVQFHIFVPDAEARMASLHEALARTHRPTYQYPFLWENWRRLGT
jgi:FkbM family methyltransferase